MSVATAAERIEDYLPVTPEPVNARTATTAGDTAEPDAGDARLRDLMDTVVAAVAACPDGGLSPGYPAHKKPGRANGVYIAAVDMGGFRNYDRDTLRQRLIGACETNGLIAEVGLEPVIAQINNGFTYADSQPPKVLRAGVAPAYQVDAVREVLFRSATEQSDVLDRAHATFQKWLGQDYDLDALDAVLATSAAHYLDGDPVWLLVVSGSGNAKTETVQSLSGADAHLVSTIASEGALLSATSKRERTKNASGGLLRQIGNNGLLAIKDVTSILSMNRELRGQVLAALREIYDGSWVRTVGTDGGQSIEWSGRITTVGAVTTAWDAAHAVISTMGDRFLLCRMDSTVHRFAAGRQAIGNTGSEKVMREELAAAVADVLAGVSGDGVQLTDSEVDKLLYAADLVTLSRTAVERDYAGNVIDAHAPEMPTRFAKQLAQIVRGAVAAGLDRDDALRLALRCAHDSMPPLRRQILQFLAGHKESLTAEVRRGIDKPHNTVDRELVALHMLGVITCAEVEVGTQQTRWAYSLSEGIDPEVLRIPTKSVSRNVTRPPAPRKVLAEPAHSLCVPTDKPGNASGCAECGAQLPPEAQTGLCSWCAVS